MKQGGLLAVVGAAATINAIVALWLFGPPVLVWAVVIIGLIAMARWLGWREREATLRALEALQRREADREEFLSLVAHEIRQPVAAIELAAESLTRVDLPFADRRDRRSVEGLAQQARRLSRLAEDVLAIGRLESKRIELNVVPADLAWLARQAADASADPARVAVDDGVPGRALADPDRMAQVMDNLIGNALKYSPANARVEVHTDRREDRVVIEVTDRGIGLAPEDMPKLFRKYGRLGGNGARGIGLGLYLARLLVEAQGGHISARSDGVGRGATFTVELPLAS